MKTKLYKETNEKFIQRIEYLLYKDCGCNLKRGREVLRECLNRNKLKEKEK